MLLARLADWPAIKSVKGKCLEYLFRSQAAGWFMVRAVGNELYLRHLVRAYGFGRGRREAQTHEAVRRGAAWLKSIQRADGGWGEGCDTYFEPSKRDHAERSTSFHTAWAVLGLMSAGEVHSELCSARYRVPFANPSSRTAFGVTPTSTRPDSHGSFT